MYFYYGCTTVGLKPFANVVTELQLTQFVTMMAQATFILGYGCAYPNRVTAYYLGYILSLFMLFRAFYDNKYVPGKAAVAGGKAIEEDPKPAKGGARAGQQEAAGRRRTATACSARACSRETSRPREVPCPRRWQSRAQAPPQTPGKSPRRGWGHAPEIPRGCPSSPGS